MASRIKQGTGGVSPEGVAEAAGEIRESSGAALSLEARPTISGWQATAKRLRRFLGDQGVAAGDLEAWDHALLAAGTRALRRRTPARNGGPMRVEVTCRADVVEVRLTGARGTLEWSEVGGEGEVEGAREAGDLAALRAWVDDCACLHGGKEDCLVLRKQRPGTTPSGAPGATPAAPGRSADTTFLRKQLVETEQVLEGMTEELAASYESLSAIFRFVAGLGQTQPMEAFAHSRLQELMAVVEADWFVFRRVDARLEELPLLASSRSDAVPAVVPRESSGSLGEGVERRALATRADVWFDDGAPLASDDPLAGVGHGCNGLSHPVLMGDQPLGVLTLGRQQAAGPFTAGQVNVIQTFADFLGIQLYNLQLQEANVQGRLVTREIEIAASIQRSLLPESLPQPPGFSLVGHCQTARQVGGDFYDAFLTGGDGLLLVIADVMGKGVPASMFAAAFRSQVRARIDLASRPGQFLSWLNDSLFADLNRVDMFITAQLAYVDLGGRRLRVASAGHPPLLVADPAGAILEVGATGLPLGIMRRNPYGETTVPVSHGAGVLLFTDGLTEARTPEGEFFGLATLRAWLEGITRVGLTARDAGQDLLARVRGFQQAEFPHDDQTFLLLRNGELPTPR